MTSFADRMKEFTDHLTDSIDRRGEALADVKEATETLRHDAQEFMRGVAQEHHERATELREFLTTHRTESRAAADALQKQHREALHRMRDESRRMLDETAKARLDEVQELRSTFQQARENLATDLRQAGQAWKNFGTARRA